MKLSDPLQVRFPQPIKKKLLAAAKKATRGNQSQIIRQIVERHFAAVEKRA